MGNEQLVEAVLEDWQRAPVNDKVRGMLGYLEKVTLYPENVGPADVVPLRAAGLSDGAISEALYVCFLLNVMDRLADAFDFEIPSPEQVRRIGRAAYKMGYWGNSLPG
jgi:alkylhydroperoxidase family enzyme